MGRIRIPEAEFLGRIELLRSHMAKRGVDLTIVYGDEYRKENLRYLSNYWPIFEKGALLVGVSGDCVLLCAPECEMVAREMSFVHDVRLVPDFLCVTVPDEIVYPLATYTSFQKLAKEMAPRKGLGIVGMDAMSAGLLHTIEQAFGLEVVDMNPALYEMRIRKSEDEIQCLMEAARIADIGYKELMRKAVPGNTELMAAGAAEGAARAAGAEAITFVVMGTGDRTHTIVGRPTDKVIQDGDMVMAALAVQYEGYIASVEVPFVAGRMSEDSKKVIDTLIRAEVAGLPHLKAGVKMRELVSAVSGYFRKVHLDKYDVYPPLHGCGCAEAESPYPNTSTEEAFMPGMTVNTDISLFGLKGGSSRIEEGYVITREGAVPMSKLVREYCGNYLAENS